MIGVFIFFVLMYFLFVSAIRVYKKNEMQKLEVEFIKSALEFHSLKYQMLQMLEIIYEKAAEVDEQYVKDYEKIKESIEQRYSVICNQFLQNIQKSLGYSVSYNSWEELIKNATPLLILASKYKNGPRKGN